MAENLVSNWSNGKRLPENYVFPPKQRPGDHNIPISNSIPIIDLAKVNGPDRHQIIQNIIEAGLEFGFFQVINHGVPSRVLDDTRCAIKDFFELPLQEKSKLYSYDMSRNCIVFTSNLDYEREEIHNWRDSLRLVCTPLQQCIQSWPEKPSICRDFLGEYVTKVRELGSRIMKLIAEGLGLEPEYFTNVGIKEGQIPLQALTTNEMCRAQSMFVHHYPPCPDPSLTLGTRKHGDTSLITILLQDNVPGLQVLKDDQWIGIQPISNAFVVNFGYQLQIVSNGKVRSAEHRVVTSKNDDRYSAALFFQPAPDFVIEPAKALVNAENPPIYKGVRYADFIQMFRKAYAGTIEDVMEPFMLRK